MSALHLLATTVAGYSGPVDAPGMAALAGSGSVGLALLRVLGALALVFALFFAGLWLWRNWQRLATSQGRAPKLAVFEAKSLGQRHTLYVIGYEQQRLLVAASPTGVTMLSSLPPAEKATETLAPAPAIPRSNFGALLLQAIGHRP